MKLNEVFTITNGIFAELQNLNVPWKNDNIATSLDLEYIGNVSGEKHISPLLETMLFGGQLTPTSRGILAKAIFDVNRTRWEKLYATTKLTYDPIENYSMTETHTGTDTLLKTPTDWKETETQIPTDWKETETQKPTDWKETETQTPTDWKETETQTPTDWKSETTGLSDDNGSTSNTSVYGFNSSNSVPTTSIDTSSKTDVSTTQSGTYETERERTGTYETERERTGTYETERERTGTFETSREQKGTMEDKTTYNTTLTRSGNIGVTTSQQMIESERALWDWNFFREVFKDLDHMLTLRVY